jgi:hypothetical protein
MMTRRTWLCAATLVLLSGRPAAAAPGPEDASRAQTLVHDAAALEQRGHLAAAEDALTQALAIDPAPTIALPLAKVRVKLGLLVEARDGLTSVVFDPAPPGELSAASAARAEAKQLFSDLAARIPHVRIETDEPPGRERPHLMLDGVALPSGAERLPLPVDPGHHVLVASAPGMQAQTIAFDAVEWVEGSVAVHLVASVVLSSTDPPVTRPPQAQPTQAQAQPTQPPARGPSTLQVGPPASDAGDRVAAARRAKFSVGRYFLESLGSAVVGSVAAYGTFKAVCGGQPCVGGSAAALGANIVATPLTVWGLGQATGGDGGLGWTFLGGLVAFSGYSAGTADPTLPLVVGLVLMPFTSALLYEVSSGVNARKVLGPGSAFAPTLAPVIGRGNGVVGAVGGVEGRF